MVIKKILKKGVTMATIDAIIEWVKPMWNFAAGMSECPDILGHTDSVPSAAYIIHQKLGKNTKIFEIKDLEPHGMCWVGSSTVMKQLYLLEEGLKSKKLLMPLNKNSPEYQAGLCLRGFSDEEVCLAALFLAYGEEKYKKSCRSLYRGEEKKEMGGRVLAEISRRITASLPKIMKSKD